MHLSLKTVSGMANSEDPNQTAASGAVWSGDALFANGILSETLFKILGHLLYELKLTLFFCQNFYQWTS